MMHVKDKEQKVHLTTSHQNLNCRQRIWNKVINVLGVDKRSLALYRFFVSLVVIGDLIDRSQDLRAHYTDWGIFPRWDTIRFHSNQFFFSVHFINGDVPFMAILFILHGLFAFCYAIGWHTKLFGFLTWYMTASLHNAFPLVLHGGDILLRILLFWSLFLPCGEVWSVDAALQRQNSFRSSPTDYRHFSIGSIAHLAQLFVMYQTSYVHKSTDEWRVTGTAVYYALNLDYFQTDFAKNFLLKYPELLKILSFLVLKWELWGPLFWIVPIKTHWFRMLGCLGFWTLHLGFQSGLRLGVFFWVCMSGPIPLIPSWFWDSIVMPRLRTVERLQFRVYLNSKSSFSDIFGRILAHMCLIPETKVSSFHELFLNGHNEDDANDIELGLPTNHKMTSKIMDNSFNYQQKFWLATRDIHSNVDYNVGAVLAIIRHSPILYLLGNLVNNFPTKIHQISDKIFMFVHIVTMKSNMNRNELSKSQLHPYQRKCRKCLKFVPTVINVYSNIFCSAFIISVVACNFQNIGYPNSIARLGSDLLTLTRLNQRWGMFSPHPPKMTFWYIIVGQLVNDETVELFRNGALHTFKPNKEVVWSKPDPFLESFKNTRWYKVFEIGINRPNHEHIHHAFAIWLCREYNSRHFGGEQLWKFEIYFVYEDVFLDGKRSAPIRQLLGTRICFDKKPEWKKN